MTYADVIQVLDERFPEFRQSHPKFDEDADCGPNVVMGSFFLFFLNCFRAAKNGESDSMQGIVERAFAFLEEAALAPDIDIPNLVEVSFMENMWMATNDEYRAIRARLGPESLQLLIEIESHSTPRPEQ